MTTVTTYQLAYLDRQHELCDACVKRGDHRRGTLGPVVHGAHHGECDGLNHRGGALTLRAYQSDGSDGYRAGTWGYMLTYDVDADIAVAWDGGYHTRDLALAAGRKRARAVS